jgi:class 3 adenylate cyclase
MKHLHRKKERSEVKKLLLIEEIISERVISLIRVAIVGWFAALAVIRALAHRRDMLEILLPIGIISFFSLLLMVHSLVAGKRTLRTGHYGDVMKYFHITVDALLIAYAAHVGLGFVREFSTALNTVDLALLYTAFFTAAASAYLFINLFRFHLYAGLYAGILLLGLYAVVPFINPVFKPLFHNPRVLGESLYFMALFTSAFLLDLILSILLAARVRRFLVKTKAQERLARFLPETIDRELLERGQDIPDKGVRCRATILFVDIHGFTTLAEAMGPEETVELLNAYYNDMIQVVFKHEGAVDKLIGDGLMAIFGAPLKSVEPESNAVRAAIDMCRQLESLNAVRKHAAKPPLRIGVGIHTGDVILGSVGGERRMDFTAIGDTVNTASRLEQFSRTAAGRIIVSETTRARLGNEFSVSILGKTTLPGKTQALRVYAVNPWLTPVDVTQV